MIAQLKELQCVFFDEIPSFPIQFANDIKASQPIQLQSQRRTYPMTSHRDMCACVDDCAMRIQKKLIRKNYAWCSWANWLPTSRFFINFVVSQVHTHIRYINSSSAHPECRQMWTKTMRITKMLFFCSSTHSLYSWEQLHSTAWFKHNFKKNSHKPCSVWIYFDFYRKLWGKYWIVVLQGEKTKIQSRLKPMRLKIITDS